MAKISIKRLLAKHEISSLLQEISNSLDTPACICDADGTPLFGDMSGDSFNYTFPLNVDGKVIGLVKGGRDSATVVSLLQYIANAEAERTTLGRETLDKYREISMLCDFGTKIGSCLDTKEVVWIVIGEIRKLLSADIIAVLLCNENGAVTEVISDDGSGGELLIASLEPGELIENFLVTATPEIVNDLADDPRCLNSPQIFSSMMCSPLKNQDKTVGYVCAGSLNRRDYRARDLKLLNTLSDQTAVALEKAQLYDRLKEAFYDMVRTLAETIEKRDPYTGNHTKRVVDYSLAIAEGLGLPEEYNIRLELAAALHDIGKLGVRDDVLLKNGPLTDDEFAQMKKHPTYGEEILKHIKHMEDVVPGVKYHHERCDGKGYPYGLKGDEIDITARIIAVA
ncbi:MAG: HD domain-containing phosphohydrolase, partial [Deltaproteobacteria bacterium]|nr:HD domain-containing phosphohydrolase [Deltaproteobacteria bacterium]